jgi:hypothetical protein
MKPALSIAAAVAVLLLSGCANMVPPSSSDIQTLPTVHFGQSAPEGKEFILHYPAGTPLPMKMLISGNLFETNEIALLNPRMKRDIYVYKRWASYDLKNWQPADQLITSKIEMHLPGENDGRNPGMLGAELNTN